MITLFFNLSAYAINYGFEFYPAVPFTHDTIPRTSNVKIDRFGDKYYFDTEKDFVASNSAPEILICLRSNNEIYFEFDASYGIPQSESFYIALGFGPGKKIKYGNFDINIGIIGEYLIYEWIYDRYKSAWGGDPGYYNGSEFIEPGTTVALLSTGFGVRLYSRIKYPLKNIGNLVFNVSYRSTNFGNAVASELNLNQDFGFNGSGLMLGLGFEF